MLFQELYLETNKIIEIYADNKSLYDALPFHKPVFDKYLRTDIGALK